MVKAPESNATGFYKVVALSINGSEQMVTAHFQHTEDKGKSYIISGGREAFNPDWLRQKFFSINEDYSDAYKWADLVDFTRRLI